MKQSKLPDIWALIDTHKIVVPTNVGWTTQGQNVMGRGVAWEAAKRWPEIKDWYGAFCQLHKSATPTVAHDTLPLIFFPTKPLDMRFPWMGWKQPSNLALIERAAQQLAVIPGEIALPLVGCGNGRLRKEQVLPILRKYLTGDRFLLVLQDDA